MPRRLPPLPSLPQRPDLHVSDVVDVARSRVRSVGRRTRPADLTGWTAPELMAYLPVTPRSVVPPRRPGAAAVAAVNALSDRLPSEGVLLARAIADMAPPLGIPLSGTLLDVVDTYLPASLEAFRQSVTLAGSDSSAAAGRAATLLLDQLRLLYDVAAQVQRAEAEHNETELRVQQSFLRERFATLSADNVLDLAPPAEATPPAGPTQGGRGAAAPVPAQGRGLGALAAAVEPHYRLRADHDPVTVFRPDPRGKGRLELRLALPKGLPVTLSMVVEKHSGVAEFVSLRSRRRRSSRRQAGFDTAQADLTATLDLGDVRRAVVIATCTAAGDPTPAVLFASEGATNSAELPTLLARRAGVMTTVVASAYSTDEGLFVRNESTVFGSLRGACTAYGFRHITWLSDDTPAV